MQTKPLVSEMRGGIEAAIQGFSTSIGPILIFLGLFGQQSLPVALSASLITATVIHAVQILLRNHAAIIPCARVASMAAYSALILQLALATPDPAASGSFVSMVQFRSGFFAASALFMLASVLVLLSGLLRLGNVFKMIPTPVTSGISNGTALLLVWLAAQQISHGDTLISGSIALGMLVAYLVWPMLQGRWAMFRPLPGGLVAPLVGVGLLALLSTTLPAPASVSRDIGSDWLPILHWASHFDAATLRLLALGLPGGVTLALIMVLETFTVVSLMETRFGVTVDANRELVALGGANMLSAALGGVPSTGSSTRSVSSWLAGGRGTPASIFCLLTTTALILLLADWLLELPPGITAGLFLMQTVLMVDRRVASRLKAMLLERGARRDRGSDQAYWLSIGIALVAFFGSLIWASLMGIAVSSLLVLRRLSDRLTAKWEYLDRYRSRRVRTPAQDEVLASNHHHGAVLRLGGHLFFGNSLRIMQLGEELHPDAEVVVIDVAQVTDMDPSASDALAWLLRALSERNKTVVFCGMQSTRSQEMRQMFSGVGGVIHSVDLDRAIELAENQLLDLAQGAMAGTAHQDAVHNRLLYGLDPEQLEAVLSLSEVRRVSKGETLFERDTLADGVWLLEEGIVSILIGRGQDSSRLATFGPGQFLGEMGFVDGKPRSASAVAETDVQALLINNQALAMLRQDHPAAVIKITLNIARELSQRVRNTSALLADHSSQESTQWDHSSLSTQSKF